MLEPADVNRPLISELLLKTHDIVIIVSNEKEVDRLDQFKTVLIGPGNDLFTR